MTEVYQPVGNQTPDPGSTMLIHRPQQQERRSAVCSEGAEE